MTRRQGIAATVGYLSLSLFLFYPVLTGHVLAARDLLRLTYPNRWLSAEIWSAGAIPLWNSAAAFGMPLAADPISGVFDPFIVFFMLPIPMTVAGTFVIWLRYLLGGVFMFRFLVVTGRTPTAAFLGGVAYIFSGFTVGSWTLFQWVAALPYLPLAMAVPYSRGHAAGRGIAAGAIFTLMLFSGAIEPLLMTMIFWSLEIICGRSSSRKARIVELGVGLGSLAGFAMMQILPTAELYRLSNRAGGMGASEAFDYSVSLLQKIGHVLPLTFVREDGSPMPGGIHSFAMPLYFSTYVGASVLPLAFLGIARGRIRYVLLGAAAVILATGRYLPGLESLAGRLPILTVLGFPVKLLYFVPPSLAILAAAGADKITEVTDGPATERAKAIALAGVFGLTVAVVAVGILWPDPYLEYPGLVITNLTQAFTKSSTHVVFALLATSLAFFTTDRLRRHSRWILILVVAADLIIAGKKTLFFERMELLDRPALRAGIPEVWPRLTSTALNDFRWGGIGTEHMHQLLDVNCGIPWMVRHSEEYCSFRMKNHETWWRACVETDPLSAANLLGGKAVRYFVCDSEAAPGALAVGWKPVAEWRELRLLENPFALAEVRFYPDQDSSPRAPSDLTSAGEFVDARLSLNGSLDARFKASSPGWLYRAESYYPGWTARTSSRSMPVVAAPDRIGQMVRITTPGDIQLRFDFTPPLFFIGLAVSFVFALASASLMAAFARHKEPETHGDVVA